MTGKGESAAGKIRAEAGGAKKMGNVVLSPAGASAAPSKTSPSP